MAGRATRKHLSTADLVVHLQLIPLGLVGILRAVRHIEDLRLRPNELLRLAVTLYAPLHLQRILFVNGRHLIDRSVTGRAADALCDVNAVVEIDVLRKVVNAVPFDRLVVTEARSNRLKIWSIGPKLAVTVHTRLGRGHAGRCRRLDRLVTITAIDAVIAHVVLVRELHWLLDLEILPGQVGRSRKLRPGVKTDAGQQNNRHQADLCNVIGALSKDLCHLKTRSSSMRGCEISPRSSGIFRDQSFEWWATQFLTALG